MIDKTFVRQWVLLGSLFLLAVVIQPTHAQQQRELLSLVNAPGGSFWDTHMRLCDIDANGKCHNADYVKSIIRFGAGGIAAAVLSLLLFVLFIPVRFFCNGFGGRNTSYGICPSWTDRRKYNKGQILSVKVLAALVLIPIVIGIGIGFESNSDISHSLSNITDSIVLSGDNIVDTLEQTKAAILTFSNDTDSQTIITNAITTATDISNKLHNVHDKAHKYDGIRNAIMIAGAVCCVVVVVLGILTALFNLRTIALLLGLLSLLILTIIWLSFGAHLVAGKFAYDVCVDIDLLEEENSLDVNSVFKTGALANLWECNNNTNLIKLQTLVNNTIGQAADDACNLRSKLCDNDPNWECATSPACSRSTLTVVTDADHMDVNDAGTKRSVAECAVNCTTATYRNESITIVASVALYTNYTSLYTDKVLPIISCQLAVDVLEEVHDPLCHTMFDALYGIAVTNLIVGIFYIPFIVAMIVGFKRFRSLEDAA